MLMEIVAKMPTETILNVLKSEICFRQNIFQINDVMSDKLEFILLFI